MEIRRLKDRLISTMEFPILVRCHLYIESGPCTGVHSREWSMRHAVVGTIRILPLGPLNTDTLPQDDYGMRILHLYLTNLTWKPTDTVKVLLSESGSMTGMQKCKSRHLKICEMLKRHAWLHGYSLKDILATFTLTLKLSSVQFPSSRVSGSTSLRDL